MACDAAGVKALGDALFLDAAEGLRLLPGVEAWTAPEVRGLVSVLAAAAELLEAPGGWAAREQALDRLEQRVHEALAAAGDASGPLAAAAATEVEAWGAFAEGMRALRLALSDRRQRQVSLDALRRITAPRRVGLDADELLGLADRLDLHQRWILLDGVRATLEQHRREALERLQRCALGRVLREDVAVIGQALGRLLADPEGCLPDALVDARGVPGAGESAFLAARLRAVPAQASLRSMPGWGLALELERPPVGQEVIRITIDEGWVLELRHAELRIGDAAQPLAWRGARRVLVEVRNRDLLLRLPGAEPSDASLPFQVQRNDGPARYTVRTGGGLSLRSVALVQVPSPEALPPKPVRGEGLRRVGRDE